MDTELRGFGVRLGQGGVRSFVLQYRNEYGQSRRMVFRRFGVLTVEQARKKARDLLGEVARGEDPADKKRAKRSGPTINEICDWYLQNAEAGKIIGRSRRPIKASTLQMDRSRIESHIRPLLGKRVIETLKLGDIEAAQADIAAGKTCKPRVGPRGGATQGGEGVAARTMSSLHSILEDAVRLGDKDWSAAPRYRERRGQSLVGPA